jgi:ubiquinone/menaquinone biosynthesis C-methylase UbiE
MSKRADQQYLLQEQYHNASNLNARIQLHVRFSTNKYGWHRWIFDHLQLPPTCRILELGCGPATLWQENLDRIPAGWHITLTDFSPGMLQEAQQHLQHSSHQFTFARVDAQSIPFEDECFDAVIANHMLYHVPNRTKAFSEIRRVLKPGGRFYASTVGRNHLRELDALIARFAISQASEIIKPNFVLENGAEEISRWFSDVKLHIYEDELVVTEVEPFVAYVLSTMKGRAFVADKLANFRKFLERELAEKGAIRITKASGLFEADKLEQT